MMKLTKNDKRLLNQWGCPCSYYPQIERAMNACITIYKIETEKRTGKISRDEAIKVLGRERWLSGIARSAFHWSATRRSDDEKTIVYFDSSKLFRE